MRKLDLAAAAALLAASLALAPQARAELDQVAQAMGSPSSVQYSGSGLAYGLGQAYEPGLPWPRLNLVRYTRTDDYADAAQSFDYTLVRADQLGGTAVPQRGEFRRAGGVAGDRAWGVNYPDPKPVGAPPTPLQHDLWISPHGIVKAALADKAKMNGATFAIERAGKFKARATVNAQNLVEKVESWVDNPVLGDLAVVTTYSDYKDYDGVKFPGHIVQTMGGFTVLDLAVADVKVNPGAVTAPAEIGQAPNAVKVDKVADGVWFISGSSHNSAAIEMRDYVILFEAPLGDFRTNAVIKAVKDAIPNKPIRYVVATHHHFDHAGGLRAAAAEGATIVINEVSGGYFRQVYANPHTIAPDALAKSGKKAKIETYRDRHVISDGTRKLELYRVAGNVHAEGFIMGYLPKEKILLEADAFSPRAPTVTKPPFINPSTRSLWDNIQRHKLDVATILPMHGRVGKLDELKIEAGVQ